MQLGFRFGGRKAEREDPDLVLEELRKHCTDCRLSAFHVANLGFICRGSLLGRVAVIGIAPGQTETEKGVAMIGASGKDMERWMRYVDIDIDTDVFVTNVVQCMPIKTIGDASIQRDPAWDEINACFGPRCLRALRSMPNLQVIITLGWIPAATLLGTDHERNVPKTKTHEGQWFESSLMPGIPIFCLSHPAELHHRDQEGNDEVLEDRRLTIMRCLDRFKLEYVINNKVTRLAKQAQLAREAANRGVF